MQTDAQCSLLRLIAKVETLLAPSTAVCIYCVFVHFVPKLYLDQISVKLFFYRSQKKNDFALYHIYRSQSYFVKDISLINWFLSTSQAHFDISISKGVYETLPITVAFMRVFKIKFDVVWFTCHTIIMYGRTYGIA